MVRGNVGYLVANLSSKGYGGQSDVDSRVRVATLNLANANISSDRAQWSGASATLTAAGAKAVGGFYQAGALDPVTITFPLGAEVPCDSSTGAALAATGAEGGTELIGSVALACLLAGTAIVAYRRRRVRTLDS